MRQSGVKRSGEIRDRIGVWGEEGLRGAVACGVGWGGAGWDKVEAGTVMVGVV